MTVCVAAICEGGIILGASDRMLTAGNIQFEPPQPKIVPLTTSIVAMIAGDSHSQAEILALVHENVRQRLQESPDKWIDVEEAVDWYCKAYNKVRVRRAEQDFLAPLGLTMASFHSQQQHMDPSLVQKIATELINSPQLDVAAIITGVDSNRRARLYQIDNGKSYCADSVGFAAIGLGSWHSLSQLMFAGYTHNAEFPEALRLVYSAKKRAEVAPGVGSDTDMFTIWGLGRYVAIGEHILTELDNIYQTMRDSERESEETARRSVYEFTKELAAASPQTAIPAEQGALPDPEDDGGETSASSQDT